MDLSFNSVVIFNVMSSVYVTAPLTRHWRHGRVEAFWIVSPSVNKWVHVLTMLWELV